MLQNVIMELLLTLLVKKCCTRFIVSEELGKAHLKVPKLPPECLVFMLILMHGNMEPCLGAPNTNNYNYNVNLNLILAQPSVKPFHENVCS